LHSQRPINTSDCSALQITPSISYIFRSFLQQRRKALKRSLSQIALTISLAFIPLLNWSLRANYYTIYSYNRCQNTTHIHGLQKGQRSRLSLLRSTGPAEGEINDIHDLFPKVSAAHLNPEMENAVQEFLLAFLGFLAREGSPDLIYSDNSSTFYAGERLANVIYPCGMVQRRRIKGQTYNYEAFRKTSAAFQRRVLTHGATVQKNISGSVGNSLFTLEQFRAMRQRAKTFSIHARLLPIEKAMSSFMHFGQSTSFHSIFNSRPQLEHKTPHSFVDIEAKRNSRRNFNVRRLILVGLMAFSSSISCMRFA
ncbi:hypothetical protein COOONC_25345, partial [Cooperia oncophora]